MAVIPDAEGILKESIYWKLPRLNNIELVQDDPYEMVMRLTAILRSFYFTVEIMIQDREE